MRSNALSRFDKRVSLVMPRLLTGVVAVVQSLPSPRPPAQNEAEPAPEATVRPHHVLVNMGVLFVLGAVVSVVSGVLYAIPATVLLSVFAAVCCVLVVAATRAVRRGAHVAGRILCAWAALVFALVVSAGAQVAGLTGFVPDLVLVWLTGVLVLGLWVRGGGLLTLSAVSVTVWVLLAYLYDRSYLPALAALVALHWFALRRRASGVLVAALMTATAVVAVAYLHDVLTPAHYPLTPGIGELLFAVAVVGSLGALWAIAAMRWATPRTGPVVSAASRLTTRVWALTLPAVVASPPVWNRLRGGFGHDAMPAMVGAALLSFAAVFVVNMPMTTRDRIRFAGWVARFALLTGGLYDVPAGLGAAMPLLAQLALVVIAYRLAVRAAPDGRFVRALAGVVVLAAVTVVAVTGWHARPEMTAPTLMVLGLVVLRIARVWTTAPAGRAPSMQGG